MQAYSKEMRRDVLAACDAGEGTRAVALRFGCSESWVRRVKQERREQGKLPPPLGDECRGGPFIANESNRSLPRVPTSRCKNSRMSCKRICLAKLCALRFVNSS